LEEKELTKLFLNTLSPFYYEKMVASAPNNFTEMVGMGMRLEEGVREGRLVNGNAPANNAKFDNNFLKKKEPEVGMVTHRGPRSEYPAYPHVAAISPIPQQPFNQQNRTQRNQSFDPIPMKYADLLPALLTKKPCPNQTTSSCARKTSCLVPYRPHMCFPSRSTRT
jgi:hypothetical protein